jgi:hypothetical protein
MGREGKEHETYKGRRRERRKERVDTCGKVSKGR